MIAAPKGYDSKGKDLEECVMNTNVGIVGIECEPIRVDDYTDKKMTFFHDPDGLALELHE